MKYDERPDIHKREAQALKSALRINYVEKLFVATRTFLLIEK